MKAKGRHPKSSPWTEVFDGSSVVLDSQGEIAKLRCWGAKRGSERRGIW